MGEVTYASLPPGQYTLKVIATNKDGSLKPALTYSFTVLHLLQNRVVCWACDSHFNSGHFCLALCTGLQPALPRWWKLEHKAARTRNLRKEIAHDFHDEMGNQLTRIINYELCSELSSNGHAHENGLGELFNKSRGIGQKFIHRTRDFIWAIDPLNDELSNLFIHLRDFGVKLFEEKRVNFEPCARFALAPWF